jgi:GxxExxY protein
MQEDDFGKIRFGTDSRDHSSFLGTTRVNKSNCDALQRCGPFGGDNTMDEHEIAREVIDAAIQVHSGLGPGLLEGAYEACMEWELKQRSLNVQRQVPMPIHYRGVVLDVGYRIDLMVENAVVIELKAVDRILPIHAAQVLSYMRLSRCKLGYVLNFNTVHMRDGIKRVVNGLPQQTYRQ